MTWPLLLKNRCRNLLKELSIMHDPRHYPRYFNYDVGFLYHTRPDFLSETYQDQVCRYTFTAFDPPVSRCRMFVALSKSWAIATNIVMFSFLSTFLFLYFVYMEFQFQFHTHSAFSYW